MVEKINISKNYFFILLIFLYVAIGLILFKKFLFLMSPDEISYFSIAEKYLNRDFFNAINGGWGPLFSWLLLPFFYFIPSQLVAAKLLLFIAGGFTLSAASCLADQFNLSRPIKKLFLLCLVPIVLFFSLYLATPDLILLCLLLAYLSVIFNRPWYERSWLPAFLAGLLAGLAYLTKAYTFPFFLLHFTLFNLLYHNSNKTKADKQKVAKRLLAGLAIFFIISGAWIGLLYFKYKKIYISAAADYNYALVGPQSTGHPFFNQGLMPPPNSTAISIWEDFSYIKIKPWHPFASRSDFIYELKKIFKNLYLSINILFSFSPLSLAIVFLYLLYLKTKKAGRGLLKNKSAWLLATMFLYLSGYLFFRLEERYLWLINLLLLLMAAELLSFYLETNAIAKNFRGLLKIIFVISFITAPLINLYFSYQANLMSQEIYLLGQNLKKNYGLAGNLASNSYPVKTLYIAYYSGSRYFGQSTKSQNEENFINEIKNNNIDYYLAWDKVGVPKAISAWPEITAGDLKDLKIYSLR